MREREKRERKSKRETIDTMNDTVLETELSITIRRVSLFTDRWQEENSTI